MTSIYSRLTLSVTGLLLFLAPASAWAHPGHGDHGWLAGAAQPLLSVDHFLAALFLAVVIGAAIASVPEAVRGAARRRSRTTHNA